MFRSLPKLFPLLFPTLLGFSHPTKKKPAANEKKQFKKPYKLTKNEKMLLQEGDNKPIIVTLYDSYDGVYHANLTIKYLNKKGLDIVKIPSHEGLEHPIFSNGTNICGIFLPGGPNVRVDGGCREDFEEALIEKASKDDIPLLGICRGEQIIGHHYGCRVSYLPEGHYASETTDLYNNKVIVAEEPSLLNSMLKYKFNKVKYKYIRENDKNKIDYFVQCLHGQHITTKDQTNKSLRVTSYNANNNTIESIEIRTGKYHILGIQHHPESIINTAKTNRKNKIRKLRAALKNNHYEAEDVFRGEMLLAKRKPKPEVAARAELSLFVNQTKKKFLETQLLVKENRSVSPSF